jgi:hypothetical protein
MVTLYLTASWCSIFSHFSFVIICYVLINGQMENLILCVVKQTSITD